MTRSFICNQVQLFTYLIVSRETFLIVFSIYTHPKNYSKNHTPPLLQLIIIRNLEQNQNTYPVEQTVNKQTTKSELALRLILSRFKAPILF